MDDKGSDSTVQKKLEKIRLIVENNPELKAEMQKLFHETISSSSESVLYKIHDEVTLIRDLIGIKGKLSCSYEFINNENRRNRLIADNIRMENSYINLTLTEKERLRGFCCFAFFQIESLLQYFFKKLYPNIDDLLPLIEKHSEVEWEWWEAKKRKDNKTENHYKKFKSMNQKNISDIEVGYLCNSFVRLIGHNDLFHSSLKNLKKVRNSVVHPGDEKAKNNADKSLHYLEFTIAQQTLESIILTCKNSKLRDSTISSKIESACFIKFDDEEQTIALQDKSYKRIKELKNGDKIKVVWINNQVVDVYSSIK